MCFCYHNRGPSLRFELSEGHLDKVLNEVDDINGYICDRRRPSSR